MSNIKEAIFAGGCFWCMAKPYYEYDGVYNVLSGYTGGHTLNPSYYDVKKGTTGHMEAIKITYDEEKISYEQLLDIYFYNIDPFDKDGQFIDRGENYSCAIFYTSKKDYQLAKEKIETIEKKNAKKVYVKLLKPSTFYAAEEYHQDYHIKNPKEYKIEFDSSGRKKKPLIGKINVNDKYYQIELFNDEIINIHECAAFELYNNPKKVIDKMQQILKIINDEF